MNRAYRMKNKFLPASRFCCFLYLFPNGDYCRSVPVELFNNDSSLLIWSCKVISSFLDWHSLILNLCGYFILVYATCKSTVRNKITICQLHRWQKPTAARNISTYRYLCHSVLLDHPSQLTQRARKKRQLTNSLIKSKISSVPICVSRVGIVWIVEYFVGVWTMIFRTYLPRWSLSMHQLPPIDCNWQ